MRPSIALWPGPFHRAPGDPRVSAKSSNIGYLERSERPRARHHWQPRLAATNKHTRIVRVAALTDPDASTPCAAIRTLAHT